MTYLEYRERRSHGTPDFPLAFYLVSPVHPRYNMVYHWHSEYELIRIQSGELYLTLDGTRRTARAGDLYFLPEGMLHSGSPAQCTYECVVFDLDAILDRNPLCKKETAAMAGRAKQIRRYFPPSRQEIHAIADSLIRSIREKPPGYQLAALGCVYSLLGAVCKHQDFEEGGAPSGQDIRQIATFKRVLSLIKLHYQEHLTLDDMAACANMSKKYFCRFFKQMAQRTPVDYLNYYRIESACEQLVATNQSVSEIAFGCGFNDVSYFIRVFRQHKGVTPTQYIKAQTAAPLEYGTIPSL